LTSKAAPLERQREWILALGFGGWAAAIALATSAAAKAALAAPAAALPVAWWMFQRPARWLMVFFACALLLPPLAAPIGNSGPHPSLAIAAAGLLAGLIWLRDWRIPANALTAGFVAFFGLLAASVAQAALHSGVEAAAGSLARVALFGISVYVFFYTACTPVGEGDRSRDIRCLYWMAAAAALFACIDFYYQFPAPAGYGPQFVWLDTGVYRRAQGLFYEASTLGNFCTFFLVMIAVALSRPRSEAPVSRKGLIAGGLVFFAALVLSYSRGSVVNLLIALGVLLWLNRRRVRWTRVIPAVAAFGAAAALVTWKIFPGFVEMYWLRLSGTTQFFFSATEGVLSGRVASWRTLVEWLTANPWEALFGIGYKTLPYSDYLGMPVVADNMYLSLLVETGVLGLGALLWLSAAILRAGYKARTSFCGVWILCFWAGQMAQMFSGDLLTYWRVLPVYFWVLALAVRQC
jgi:hypothetical protein